MDKVINLVNFAGWSFLLFHVTISLLIDPHAFRTADITIDVYALAAIQLFQILDIVLILMGKSKGSLVGSFFQILGRITVALFYVSPDTDRLSFALMVIMWGIADINRYLYYLVKIRITAVLRYNCFLVLYPLGVYGEMRVINDYIKRNAETISYEMIMFTRFAQAMIVLGMLFLYNYMLGSRKRMVAKNYGFDQNGEQNEEIKSRPRSPKPKRD